MNPLWFFVGLEVGDRIRPLARQLVQSRLQSAWEKSIEYRSALKGRQAYRDWLDALPTTKGVESGR